jgi:hypothetical protein
MSTNRIHALPPSSLSQPSPDPVAPGLTPAVLSWLDAVLVPLLMAEVGRLVQVALGQAGELPGSAEEVSKPKRAKRPSRRETNLAKARTLMESMSGATVREKLSCFHGPIDAEILALVLDFPVATLYLWARQNRIPHTRPNGTVKFDPAVIADWWEGNSSTPLSGRPRPPRPSSGHPSRPRP